MRSRLDIKYRLAAQITALALLLIILAYSPPGQPTPPKPPAPETTVVVPPPPVPAPERIAVAPTPPPPPPPVPEIRPDEPAVVPPAPPAPEASVPPPPPIVPAEPVPAKPEPQEPTPPPPPPPAPEPEETPAKPETPAEPEPEAPTPEAPVEQTVEAQPPEESTEAVPPPPAEALVEPEPAPETELPVEAVPEPPAPPAPADLPTGDSGSMEITAPDAPKRLIDTLPINHPALEVLGERFYWLSADEVPEADLKGVGDAATLAFITPAQSGETMPGYEHIATEVIPVDEGMDDDTAERFVRLSRGAAERPVLVVTLPGSENAVFLKGAYLLAVRELPLEEALTLLNPEFAALTDGGDAVRHRLLRLDAGELRKRAGLENNERRPDPTSR